MNAAPSQFNDKHRTARGRAFSMTELLVVIAIIAVIAGILLVALKGVRERALATQTRATMQEFSKACDAFQIEHGRYPGIIPESILAQNPQISGTENALLDMMGGVIRGDDPRFNDPEFAAWDLIEVDPNTPLGRIRVNKQLIGNGPEINGRPYSPYFTPKGDELRVARGQMLPSGDVECCPELGCPTFQVGWCLPDLLDAWGQQIVFVRRARAVGPLVGDPADAPPAQFLLGTMKPYLNSTGLGDFGRNQVFNANNNPNGSILSGPSLYDFNATFAQIIRHPSFGAPTEPLTGTARGAYVLISPGKDGIYFSRQDGPGTPGNPVSNIINDQDFGNPQVVEEYDDIRLFGGG